MSLSFIFLTVLIVTFLGLLLGVILKMHAYNLSSEYYIGAPILIFVFGWIFPFLSAKDTYYNFAKLIEQVANDIIKEKLSTKSEKEIREIISTIKLTKLFRLRLAFYSFIEALTGFPKILNSFLEEVVLKQEERKNDFSKLVHDIPMGNKIISKQMVEDRIARYI